MKAVAFFGRVHPGALLRDGQQVDMHIPASAVRGVLFDAFAPECMAPAANEKGEEAA